MKKRTMLLGSTLLISLIYAGGFILLFSLDSETSSKSVLLVSDENSEKKELIWLQAGVFKEESSYLVLREKIQSQGLDVYCIDVNELTYVLVEPETEESRVDDIMEKLVSEGIEVIKKKAAMDDIQQQLYDEKKLEELMEGLIAK
ncbi:MAG: hypothetical protein IJC38_02380 [Erysipelotrichaceae bacterium]|nr:hypothetical protein [Erysipelotrichaceae bacterium]